MAVLKKATIKSYDPGTHTVSVQITGSLAVWLDGVRVATNIPAADVIAGRQCSVLFLDPSNQDDAVVVTIQGALPSGGGGSTTFLGLTDTPASYAGQAGQAVQVNTAANALVFRAIWDVLQTFNASIKLAAGQSIQDSGGAARYTPSTTSPHNKLTGDTQFTGLASGGTVTFSAATDIMASMFANSVNSFMGLMVGAGSSVTPQANYVTGIGGRAAVSNPAAVGARGLDFAAQTVSTATLTELVGCKATTINILRTVTNTYAFLAPSPTMIVSTDTNVYQFYASAINGGINRHPFYDTGTAEDGDAHGNVFKTATQFFSTTRAFGGGKGVMGIANAAVVPTTNPAGGGILYASGGALLWRGSAGTVTTIAPA